MGSPRCPRRALASALSCYPRGAVCSVTVIAWKHAALGGSNRAAIRQPLAWSRSNRANGKSAAMCLSTEHKAESPAQQSSKVATQGWTLPPLGRIGTTPGRAGYVSRRKTARVLACGVPQSICHHDVLGRSDARNSCPSALRDDGVQWDSAFRTADTRPWPSAKDCAISPASRCQKELKRTRPSRIAPRQHNA